MNPLISIFNTILFLAAATLAAPADFNSTSDHDVHSTKKVGWVAPDGRRSTWGIVWSCLSVFILCSWKCMHLNIPTVDESQAGWTKVSKALPLIYVPEGPLLRKWGRKVAGMVLMCIAPEFVVAVAVEDRLAAHESLTTLRITLAALDEGRGYTMTHAFFANMGGLVLAMTSDEEPASDQCYATTAGKGVLGVQRSRRVPPTIVARMILTLEELAILERDLIPLRIRKEDIQDRSKSDTITKLVALCQAGWLVSQGIARGIKGLAITELELVTIAFIFCALVTYGLWWQKPFDVDRRCVIICQESHVKRLFRNKERQSQKYFLSESSFNRFRLNELGEIHSALGMVVVIFGFLGLLPPDTTTSRRRTIVAVYLTSAVFSLIHFGAWNWEFPSAVTHTLWRASAAAALGSSLTPIIWVLPLHFVNNKWLVGIWIGLESLSAVVYICSRMILLGLTFYCFTSMPPSVYEPVDWTAFLPHFS